MSLFSRVPLAWLNLAHDKRRLVLRVLGVAFAVFLMFVELGFYDALLDASIILIEQFNGQIIIVSSAHYAMAIKEPFSIHRLTQAREAPGVQDVYPVYLEYAASLWKDVPQHDRAPSPIRVIAFDPDKPVLRKRDVNKHQADLKILYNVLFDRKSRPDYYGNVNPGDYRELARHKVHVVDTFHLGTNFASDGNVIMSDVTYAHLFPNEESPNATLDFADIGVVRVQDGADVGNVLEAIRKILLKDPEDPEDVKVLTRKEFIDLERDYWRTTTPIGFIFRFGVFMGFVVGCVICYQIISTDVAEHLPEYATLKAIGYGDPYLSVVVLREALWLAALGFVPGLVLSWLLYGLVDAWIGLPMMLALRGALLVLALTILMCAVSGLLSLRKVRKADPAEVFA